MLLSSSAGCLLRTYSRTGASSLSRVVTPKSVASSSRAPALVCRRLLSSGPTPSSTPPTPPPPLPPPKSNKSTSSSNLAWQFGTVFAVFGAYVVGTQLTEIATRVEEDAFDEDTAVNADGNPLREITSRVYFDVSVGGNEAGRIVVGLYGNAVPKTVMNFETLAQGDTVHARGAKLAYAGSTFHRIIPEFMVHASKLSVSSNKQVEQSTTCEEEKNVSPRCFFPICLLYH